LYIKYFISQIVATRLIAYHWHVQGVHFYPCWKCCKAFNALQNVQ